MNNNGVPGPRKMYIFQPAINDANAKLRVYPESDPDKTLLNYDNVASPGLVKYKVWGNILWKKNRNYTQSHASVKNQELSPWGLLTVMAYLNYIKQETKIKPGFNQLPYYLELCVSNTARGLQITSRFNTLIYSISDIKSNQALQVLYV